MPKLTVVLSTLGEEVLGDYSGHVPTGAHHFLFPEKEAFSEEAYQRLHRGEVPEPTAERVAQAFSFSKYGIAFTTASGMLVGACLRMLDNGWLKVGQIEFLLLLDGFATSKLAVVQDGVSGRYRLAAEPELSATLAGFLGSEYSYLQSVHFDKQLLRL